MKRAGGTAPGGTATGNRRVRVIGAGIAGLVTAKVLHGPGKSLTRLYWRVLTRVIRVVRQTAANSSSNAHHFSS